MGLEQLSQRQFDQFRDFIYAKSGIRVDDRKVTLLSNRIRRRLKAGSYADFDSYYRHLVSPRGSGELEHFLDEITTNETFFFRTASHYDWFSTTFIAEAVAAARKNERQRDLRIWSAGCSTGAEPYTIAICLLENMFRLQKWTLHVLGTDISAEVLRMAEAGTYKVRSIESVKDKQRSRFLRSTEDGVWHVRPEVRALVDFKHHNLLDSMPGPRYDCIFICNVLIYFDRESKHTVVKNLIAALAPGGYLVVGPSEGIYDMLDPLEKCSPFLYRKAAQVKHVQ